MEWDPCQGGQTSPRGDSHLTTSDWESSSSRGTFLLRGQGSASHDQLGEEIKVMGDYKVLSPLPPSSARHTTVKCFRYQRSQKNFGVNAHMCSTSGLRSHCASQVPPPLPTCTLWGPGGARVWPSTPYPHGHHHQLQPPAVYLFGKTGQIHEESKPLMRKFPCRTQIESFMHFPESPMASCSHSQLRILGGWSCQRAHCGQLRAEPVSRLKRRLGHWWMMGQGCPSMRGPQHHLLPAILGIVPRKPHQKRTFMHFSC